MRRILWILTMTAAGPGFALDALDSVEGFRANDAQVEDARRAVRARPASPFAHFQLARAYEGSAQPERAIPSYRQVLYLTKLPRVKGNFSALQFKAHSRLNAFYAKAKQWKKAAFQARRAVTVRPESKMHFPLGVALRNLGKPMQALDAFEEAVRRHPRWAAARFQLGIQCLQLGMVRQAAAQRDALRNLDPRLADRLSRGLSQEARAVMPNLPGINF